MEAPVCPFALAMWRVLLPESGSIHERRRVEGVVERALVRWESVDLSSEISPVRARKRRSEIVSGSRGGAVAVGIVCGVWVLGGFELWTLLWRLVKDLGIYGRWGFILE